MAERKGISKTLRFEVFKRDNFTCRYCGRKTPEVILEIDHVIPVSKGGTNEFENLVTSCFECNRGKSNGLLNNVMIEKDIHDESVLLAEREMQLAEYNYIRKRVKEREDGEIEELIAYFSDKFDYPGYAERSFKSIVPTVRECLKFISYIDIMDFIDLSIEKTSHDTRGLYHHEAAAKYLAGILRNKLRGREVEDNG
jgi:hypothetical protein